MKRRLYQKLILAWICFAVLSFVSVAGITSSLVEKHLIKNRTEGMYREANVIAAGRLAQNYTERASLQDTYTNLLAVASYQSMRLWLMDSNGKILIDTAVGYDQSKITQLDSFDPVSLSGNYYQTGRFFDYFDEDMLSVVAPITSNYITKGYIAVHYEKNKLETEKNSILNCSYITLAMILALSLIVLITFTFVVYFPIRRIIHGADEYAAGNLNYKIPVESNDEIGYLAASMNYMAGELNNSGESQRKFISNISHDFRSPLTSIQGYVQAMKDGVIPADNQEKYLDIILYETERLTKLTSNLIDMNNYDRDNIMLEQESFDIHKAVKMTCESLEGTASNKQITFTYNLCEPEELLVYADKQKILQVLRNLCDNAIKFSHEESEICLHTFTKGEKVFISIKDSGIGIPREDLNLIWDRFYKTDLSRGKDKLGSGLGLAICREIINAHKQTIDVVSTVGVGSEFVFTLPKA